MFAKKFLTPEERQARYIIRQAAAIEAGHEGTPVQGAGHQDQYVCQCGWKSAPYSDGVEWAYEDWWKHALEHGARYEC